MADAGITGTQGRAGRMALMEAVVAEHETPLLRYAARILGGASAAEDVVQNVFIKLFRQWQDGMQPSPQLRSWLFRVTHNEAVDYIRRESRLRLLHEKHGEEEAAACAGGKDCPMSADDRKALVLRFLKKLKPPEQQVVLLRMQEGMSYREISDVTGRSEGNVGNILHHAVKKLSMSLKKAGAV